MIAAAEMAPQLAIEAWRDKLHWGSDMDRLTLVSNLVRDLAWPLTSVAVLYVLLHNLPKLQKFVKTIKVKDVEFTLRGELEVARAEAAAVEGEAGGAPPSAFDDKVIQIAKIDSALAVIEIWRGLEQALISLMQHNGLMRFTMPGRFVEQLHRLGKLTDADLRLYQTLKKIRNEAVHSRDNSPLTVAEVADYDRFVGALIMKLERMKSEPEFINIEPPPRA